MAAKTLGRWCSPEVILIVATRADEPALMLHAARQARKSGARILLVYASPARRTSSAARSLDVLPWKSSEASAQTSVERTMTQLLWKRVWCESIAIKNLRVGDIPAFVRSNAVDRVIVASGGGGPVQRAINRSVAEELMTAVDVPICVIGRHVPADLYSEKSSRRILLAASLQCDCDVQLRFACRLAQQHGANLTVLHVFDRWNSRPQLAQRSPIAVGARLPLSKLNEAGYSCPLEIAVREGDPAREILNFDARTHHDFIILGSPSTATVSQLYGRGVARAVMIEARCPLIIVKSSRATVGKPAANELSFGGTDSLSKRAS